MGIFDRLWNLGKGVSRSGTRGSSERISEAELEAELETVRRPPSPAPTSPGVASESAPTEEPLPTPDVDEDGKVIKTL